MSKTYAIGDVHGCLDQLQRLVELCEQDAGEGQSKLVFLGDYIDRGPDSRGVIEFLMDLQKWSPDEIICLRGNHEDLLLAALEGQDAEQSWLLNGGYATLRSYGAACATDIPMPHIAWLRSLPLFHDDRKRFFVHAGVHPDRPLDQQRTRDLLWIKEPFLSSEKVLGRFIVHGHTPLKSGRPEVRINRVNIDTGAVFGRTLTSAVFDSRGAPPSRFLSVDPNAT
ncbi:metallophosphoesterase family protein [Bradyrhizobium sp. 151]|uniref:metallophosphoesterase family protein n=1 Tax=Bradyrhizobium sp. 151 TaxID=2782626 RepID=UPI001FFBFDF1|nr:metallophosphoesterase family protein [Bradyrhizobium sp. 151]